METGGETGELASPGTASGDTRPRRWRRVLAGALRPAIAEPVATTGPAATAVVQPVSDAPATDGAPAATPVVAAARPGLVAVAIARALVAIDFAIGGGKRPPHR